MRVLIFALLSLVSFGSVQEQNQRLKKTNNALRQALRSLNVEQETSVGGDCETYCYPDGAKCQCCDDHCRGDPQQWDKCRFALCGGRAVADKETSVGQEECNSNADCYFGDECHENHYCVPARNAREQAVGDECNSDLDCYPGDECAFEMFWGYDVCKTTTDVTKSCLSDHRTWSTTYGDCDTYLTGASNHDYCAQDYAGGLCANQVCPGCGECTVSDEAREQAVGMPCTSDANCPSDMECNSDPISQKYEFNLSCDGPCCSPAEGFYYMLGR